MDYATFEDVTSRHLAPIAVDRENWVRSLIDDATSLVRGKLPSLDTWITTGQVPASEARRVVCEIVLRRVRNPGGFRAENTVDYGYTRDPDAASGQLAVLTEELDALRPPATPTGVGTAPLAIPGWRIP